MKFIEGWIERSEILRYLIAGGMNTIITYIAYLLLLPIIAYQVAFFLTYVAGIFITYVLNALFVFRQPLDWKKALQFPIIYIVQYAASAIMLELFVRWGVSPAIAPAIVLAILTPPTYLASRLLLKSGASTPAP